MDDPASRRLIADGGLVGEDDQVWLAADSAERIRQRRAHRGLSTTVITSPDAGHRPILPGEPMVTVGSAMRRGGSEAADRELGRRAWSAIFQRCGVEAHCRGDAENM